MKLKLLALFCLVICSGGLHASGSGAQAWFHTDFSVGPDGYDQAGDSLAPIVHGDVVFDAAAAEVLLSSAASSVTYPLPDGFPTESGTIEWIFRGELSDDESLPEYPLLILEGEGQPSLALNLVAVGQSVFTFNTADPDNVSRAQQRLGLLYRSDWYRRQQQHPIHHVVLTWDGGATPHPIARMFINGEQSRWRGSGQIFDPPLPSLSRLSLRGADRSTIHAGDVAIYDQPFDDELVAYAASLVNDGRHSVAAVTAEARRMAAVAKREDAERQALIDQLEGRVGRIIHRRGRDPQNFDFPGGIVATGIRPEDIGEIDLSQFLVIYAPQGGAYELTDEQNDLIVEYVNNGGGFVGSCQGAYYARRIGLLDFETVHLLATALFNIYLEPHPITEGYGERVVMHHGNGPIMIPRSGCRVIGAYPIPGEPEERGAILVGERGEGRVVLFGSHPLGGSIGKVAYVYAIDNQVARYGAEEQGTVDMFVNSLLYAAGLIHEE